jgi:hypothetical protein
VLPVLFAWLAGWPGRPLSVTLAVATAEILLSYESITAANQFLDGFSTRHKRKRSFTRELNQCRQQMGKPAVPGNA